MQEVTCCIPSIRGPKALPTLFSVVNQTRPPNRVLFDDCSKDKIGSDPFAARFMYEVGASVIFGTSEDDVATSRNRLVSHASTRWVWFVDDDILPYHDCLAQMLRCAEEHGAVAVGASRRDVMPFMDFFNSKSGVLGRLGPPTQERLRRADQQLPLLDATSLLVKKSLWESADTSYKPDYRGGEDFYVTSQLCADGKCYLASGAETLHMREVPSPWWGNPQPEDWWEIQVASKLPPHAWKRLKQYLYLGIPRDENDDTQEEQIQTWMQEAIYPKISHEEYAKLANALGIPPSLSDYGGSK